MMSARSTPNLQQSGRPDTNTTNTSIYSYLNNQSGLSFVPVVPTNGVASRNDGSPPPTPPVRDAFSLKSIKYGPGHEKFPSWPVPAAAETPQALRGPPSGGSHRSKSWTDHTNYPKEKVVTYTRPYMKRQHSYTKQLKTVMERCEKINPETYESRGDKVNERVYFPRVDRDGKTLGDMEYMVPSPPERDTSKPQLTQADLEEYARSYQDPTIRKDPEKYNQSYNDLSKSLPHLTQADLEEYTRSYEEALSHQHQKQPSYAQSEGYHSYVSSTDSTATPFLDRLRRDSEATAGRPQSSVWDDTNSEQEREIRHEGRDSVVTTSSGSVSSSETLKWHGSMSDVSVASSSCTHLANSSSSRQLIAHSARVQTPQRHHSESVLYMGEDRQQEGWKDRENWNNNHNKLKLFPVNTYTVQPEQEQSQAVNHRLSSLTSQTSLSVADRVNELERQQTRYTYLDPDKKHRVSDPTLKAIQKKALLSFYERHHSSSSKSSWRSEPQLAQSAVPQAPHPPPRPQPQTPSRRASCASDYASSLRKTNVISVHESKTTDSIKVSPKHQHSNSCGSLSTDLLGPVIMGPSISIDDWVPERPPKKPHLRTVYPDLFQEPRVPSPDLPPPSPPVVLENEVFNNDEPLPPPPTDIETAKWEQEFNNRLKSSTGKTKISSDADEVFRQTSGLPENISRQSSVTEMNLRQTGALTEHKVRQSSGVSDHSIRQPNLTEHNLRHSHIRMSQRSRPTPNLLESKTFTCENILPNPKTFIRSSSEGYQQRKSFMDHNKRHSQKLIVNGNIAVSQKVTNGLSDPCHTESLRIYKPPMQPPTTEDKRKPPAQLPLESRNISVNGVHPSDFKTMQRSSFAEHSEHLMPPPLHPRQMRINQSMRARISEPIKRSTPPRNSPPRIEDKRDEINSSTHMNFTMSQSKASYLASRRERDHGLPNSDIGSYKRTMSPSGQALQSSNESIRTKECNTANIIRNNNNTTLLRRASLVEAKCPSKKDAMLTVVLKCDNDEKKCNLPDVLPINAKVSPSSRSQFIRNVLDDKPVDRLTLVTPPQSPSAQISPQKSPPISPKHSPVNTLQKTSLSPLKCINSLSPLKLPDSPKSNSPSIKSASPVYINPPSPVKSESPVKLKSESPSELVIKSVQVGDNIGQPKVIEGLQLIQRTEVTLRVNTCTIDAASQTEKEELSSTPLPTRRKLQEEIECEKLSQDLVNYLSPSDRLKGILVPGPEHKKPTDYVSGLFKVEVTSRSRPQNSPFRSRNTTPNSSPPPSITSTSTASSQTETTAKTITTSEVIIPVLEPSSPLSATSTYFTTSESKAKFLTRYSRDMNQYNIVKDTKDLNQKKEELVSRLDRKLEVLRSEQLVVSEECRMNDELGENVERHVMRVARPHEAAKFKLHVEEVGKITSLLLGLSGRLARVENALMEIPSEHCEKKVLEEKREKLQGQLEEAKKLKESIDKRSVSVSNMLYKYLNSEEYADYDHFINMKAKLIMDSREISDKIKLGEEQLNALKETLTMTM